MELICRDKLGMVKWAPLFNTLVSGALEKMGIDIWTADSDEGLLREDGAETTFLFVLDDPNEQLPEEVGMVVGDSGVQLEDATSHRIVAFWKWPKVVSYESEKQSDDPTDMELLHIQVKESYLTTNYLACYNYSKLTLLF
jgi:hypothetical protein